MDLVMDLPAEPMLIRALVDDVNTTLAFWRDAQFIDLGRASDPRLHSLDKLLTLPAATIRDLLRGDAIKDLPTIEAHRVTPLAPCESQEVWAAGVTYGRSREARMLESTSQDVYADVYVADRPEIFFKAAGWRVRATGQSVGIRSDSTWDVPEPELAVLSNRFGEVVAYSIGNDMSSRSIEGANPLYLPQAKVYDKSCAIGPGAVLATDDQDVGRKVELEIRRGADLAFSGRSHTADMVRRPTELARLLTAVYDLPVGAWLLTGTGVVPPETFTLCDGDEVNISIDRLGRLRNYVEVVHHSGATALPAGT